MLIKKDIIGFIFLIMVFIILLPKDTLSLENKFYNINLHYSKEGLTLKNIAVMSGKLSPISQTGGNYRLELIGFKEESLKSINFEIPLIITTDKINPETGEFSGEIITLEETDFILNVPYFPNADKINIYSPENELLLTIDISKYSIPITPSEVRAEFNFGYIILLILIIISIYLIIRKIRKND